MVWYVDEDQFIINDPIPTPLVSFQGPNGLALVDVYEHGRTTTGWGLVGKDGGPGFAENYRKHKFWAKPRLVQFENGKPFAFVMRSMSLVMVDLDRHMADGGEDGFISAATMELPPTLAETSRSGSGRHLFYSVEDEWSDDFGFGMYDDALGIEPGIDIRATGCAYHYPSQKWNDLPIAPLPESIEKYLVAKKNKKDAQATVLQHVAVNSDSEEALVVQDALLQELAKPIPVGKRNASLFALGSKMMAAGIPEWMEALADRANEVGLDAEETNKIIANVERYS